MIHTILTGLLATGLYIGIWNAGSNEEVVVLAITTLLVGLTAQYMGKLEMIQ